MDIARKLLIPVIALIMLGGGIGIGYTLHSPETIHVQGKEQVITQRTAAVPCYYPDNQPDQLIPGYFNGTANIATSETLCSIKSLSNTNEYLMTSPVNGTQVVITIQQGP